MTSHFFDKKVVLKGTGPYFLKILYKRGPYSDEELSKHTNIFKKCFTIIEYII